MSIGEYIAYTGALSNQRQLEVIANNIANVSTSGFRRDNTIFDALAGGQLHFARAATSQIDQSPGAQQLTGNPLNAAVDGDGFFVVESADGTPQYTRRGDFRVDHNGDLVLPNGLRVLGWGGALQVPPGAQAGLLNDGTLLVNGQSAGRLRVVGFEDSSLLEKSGESLFAPPPGVSAVPVQNPRIAVGYVETSNVNLASEMVALITATRAFEAAIRSMNIQDELTGSLIQAQS
jgi:flagellar basal body rod protein FlgG